MVTSTTPPGEDLDLEFPRQRWQRHPADLARLVFLVLVVAGAILVASLWGDELSRLSADLVGVVDGLPDGLTSFLVGSLQLAVFAVPILVVAGLAWRRAWKVLSLLALAAALAVVLMAVIEALTKNIRPPVIENALRVDSWFTDAAFPGSPYLAAATAMVVAANAFMSRAWRRWAWAGIAAVAMLRVVTATEVPVHLIVVVALGAAAGSLAVLMTGAPPRRLDEDTLTGALDSAGFSGASLTPLSTARGHLTLAGTAADGTPLFVKVIGRDVRDSGILLSAWRSLWVKGMGDDVPRGSPRELAEHEVLASSIARAGRAEVPRALGVGVTDDGAALVVLERTTGTSLADLPADQLTDDLLRAAWHEVGALQRRRVAHRALQLDNFRVDGDRVTVVDLGRAEIAASNELLGADVAELLSASAVVVGAERAVAAARSELEPRMLARALPLLQPVVLTPQTRSAVKKDKPLLGAVRDRTAEAAGVEKVELAKVQRITGKGVLTLAGSIVLGYYVFSIVSDWSTIWATIKTADWAYVPWMLVMMVLSYVGGAISLLGAVTVRLPFLQTTEVMFAQSFLNRFTPANAGGMALRATYLQKEGVDLVVGAAAVGLTSAASGAVQVVFIVVFFIWGGTTDSFSDIDMPSVTTILLVVIGVGALVGALLLSSWGKRTVLPWVRRTLGKALGSFRDLAKRPDQLFKLFGGAALGKLATIVAFWLSCLAFGVDLSFAKAGALYMVANTVGSAVPTPGGVGGIEAALTAVLLSYGVDNATAAAVVLLFRFITFWLPTLPGWVALQDVQRRGIV